MAVARIRAAVKNGGQVPLSLTPSSVPPEAEQHALVLAARAMTASTANLGAVVVTMNGGIVSPFNDLVKIAEKWITDTGSGANLPTYPTDPQQAGNGVELVPSSAQFVNGSYTLTGLRVGVTYLYTAGPNEVSLACGSVTLTGTGQFVANATTAVIAAVTTPGVSFLTASVQQVTAAANTTSGGNIRGQVDMSTDDGWGCPPTNQCW